MKSNNKSSRDDEIDILELINLIWKEKILIISITLIIAIIGYIYGTFKTKIFKSEFTIRYAPNHLFSLSPFIFSSQATLSTEFNDEFRAKILSFDNLMLFVEQNNNIEDLKSYFKEKKIDKKTYFKGKIGSVTSRKNKDNNKYYLKYPSYIDGHEFFSQYILFTKQQTLEIFKPYIKKIIRDAIAVYDDHYKIAKKINLDKPILKSMADADTLGNEPSTLFYTLKSLNELYTFENDIDGLFFKGTEVLSQILTELNNLLNQIDDMSFDYNPIADGLNGPSTPVISTQSYTIISFILGLIISTITVFIKSKFRDNL